jgi:elongation factor G
VLELEPRGPGEGFEFNNEVVGGRIPQEYIPSVEKGVIQALQSGGFQIGTGQEVNQAGVTYA